MLSAAAEGTSPVTPAEFPDAAIVSFPAVPLIVAI